MESLRWILLLIGVLVVAGIYGWTSLERRSRRADPDPTPDPGPRREPQLSAANRGAGGPYPAAREAEKIIALHIKALPGQRFRGPDIDAAARACGLIHGYMRIYNRHPADRTDKAPVFSLANMLEPGVFDMEKLDGIETTGLTLFLALPGPVAAPVAFNDMLETARSLAESLSGEIQDETHSTLSVQRVENIREELKEFERRRHLGRSH